MNNKYVYMIVAGVALFGWYWTGYQPYYANEDGGMGTGYIMAAVLALALGAGNSDGDDVISTLIGSIKSFIPNLIALTVAVLVGRAIYEGVASGAGFNAMVLVESVSTLVASAILIALTMSCLKKAG